MLLAAALQALLESPRSPHQQLAGFRCAPGFVVELVASEPEASKVVDVAFDDAGRMWAVTALEYPLDGNESLGAAELYRNGGRDKVLIFDTPLAKGRQVPRVFADGLAMPMAVLPYGNGVIVGHGPEILFLGDGDGDGRADTREVLLSGFGIEDSHLLPHRFLRGPGGWIYVAQGAFNSSRVRTRTGEIVPFDACKLGRFRPDGSAFEVVGFGLNNIWGIVLDRSGQVFIQEANDLGYSLVPFFLDASYPGIGDHKHRPYSPWQPALAKVQMGGTGLSGLALSQDRNYGFASPWNETAFVANPIVGRVQSITIERRADGWTLDRAEDLLSCDDPWFRPVAIHFGPDGALYVVDWYNEIISHNEVPRSDPRRDRVSSRIWRVRHESSSAGEATPAVQDLTRVPTHALASELGSGSTWRSRAAWHQIVERRAIEIAPELAALVRSERVAREARILALWSLEDLGLVTLEDLAALSRTQSPELAREAARAVPALVQRGGLSGCLDVLESLVAWAELGLRVQVTHSLGQCFRATGDARAAQLLASRATPPAMPGSQSEPPAADPATSYREFERSLVRAAFEARAKDVAGLLRARAISPIEGRVLACLALAGSSYADEGATLLAADLDELDRPLGGEELALLARSADEPGVEAALRAQLGQPRGLQRCLRALLEARVRCDAATAAALLETSIVGLSAQSLDAPSAALLLEAGRAWRLSALVPAARALAADEARPLAVRADALATCIELGAQDPLVCDALARASLPGEELQRLACIGLAGARGADMDVAHERLLELLPELAPTVRSAALAELAAGAAGAATLLDWLAREEIPSEWVAARTRELLTAAAPNDERLARLFASTGRATLVLELPGDAASWAEADVTLEGPCTVEAWVRLAPGVTNEDGILGVPGGADCNFAEGRFRLYAGPGIGDVVVARRSVEPELWTHVAISRDASGALALYQGGEFDASGAAVCTAVLEGLDIGRATPGASGGAGAKLAIAELRIWNRARSAAEIGADFRRSFAGEPRPEGLLRVFPADFGPGALRGTARVREVLGPDAPRWIDPAREVAEAALLARAERLAQAGGDSARGRDVFARTCGACHMIGGEGGRIGPPLDGAGMHGRDSLLRAIVIPSAAVESGYRELIVTTRAGEHWSGFLASQDEQRIVLRRQGREDLVIPRGELESARFGELSVMPEGLLEGLDERDARDLLAYVQGLR